jgi:hypothetical protein
MQTGQKGQAGSEFYLLFLFYIAKSLYQCGTPSDRSDHRSVAANEMSRLADRSLL